MDAFTSCGCELLSVYMWDNRHRVPSNSCCSSLLPVARIRKGERSEGKLKKGGWEGVKEERKAVPLAQGSDVHLSTLFSQLSPV